MARFSRLEVITRILDTGLIPLFSNGNVNLSIELVSACSRGGAGLIEFDEPRELAYPVFTELIKHFSTSEPTIILGRVPSWTLQQRHCSSPMGRTLSSDPASTLKSLSCVTRGARSCISRAVRRKQKSPMPKNMARKYARCFQGRPSVDRLSSRRSWHPPPASVDADRWCGCNRDERSEPIKAGAAAVGMGRD